MAISLSPQVAIPAQTSLTEVLLTDIIHVIEYMCYMRAACERPMDRDNRSVGHAWAALFIPFEVDP